MQANALYETLQGAELAITLRSSRSRVAAYLSGAVMAYFVPSVELTMDSTFVPDPATAEEYQARRISADPDHARIVLEAELKLFEEDFLDLDEQSEVQRYRDELLALGHESTYSSATRSRIIQEVVMGDQYRIDGQAGAVGPGAVAVGNEFVQLWNDRGTEGIDLRILADELHRLRSALRAEVTKPEHDVAVAEIAKAEVAANDADGPRALQHLKAAGRWALDTAESIGVAVATSALKAALGL